MLGPFELSTELSRTALDASTNDELVDELKRRVFERRVAGDYPVGLEQQLESHFDHMLHSLHGDEASTETLREAIESVGEAIGAIGQVEVATTSRAPGGSALHRTAAQLVRRHVQQVESELAMVAVAVREALDESARLIEVTRLADERELSGVLAMVLDRLAVVDHLSEMVIDIEDRLVRLEAQCLV